MAEWLTPIVDRTEADTVEAFNNQMIEAHLKGALNYSDLNRIENNYKYLIENLQKNGYYVNHKYRNYTETEPVVTEIEVPGTGGGGTTGGIVEPYIESSGTQYILTGINGKSGLKVEAKYSINSNSMSDNHFLSSAGSGWTNRCYLMSVSNSKYTYGYISEVTTNFALSANTPYKIEVDTKVGKQTATINGATAMTNSNSTSYNNGVQLSVFGLNVNGNVSNLSSGKIYYLSIYDNDVLIRDFVPKLDDNGVACLYDKVESKYYYNAGTGSFTYGENVYTPAEYIESNGTQFVNTRFNANQDTRIVLDIDTTNSQGLSFPSLFATDSSSSVAYRFTTMIYTGQNGFHDHYGNQIANSSNIGVYGRLTVDKNKNVTYLNGKVVSTFTYTNFQSTVPLVLLASQERGSYGYFANAKVYSCQIYDNDVLIRDFIPVVDASGVGLLYDQLNGVPYYNAGTGSFTYGYKAGELPAGFIPLNYIESTGTQYINTGYNPTPNTTIEAIVQFTSTTVQQRVCSARGTFFFEVYINGKGNFAFGYQDGSGNWIDTGVAVDTNEHTVVLDGHNKVFKIDGVVVASLEGYTATQASSEALELFRATTGREDYYGKEKMYVCKIYEAGVLVRDYVPALDLTLTPCLFDLVNGQAIYNAGSGSFDYELTNLLLHCEDFADSSLLNNSITNSGVTVSSAQSKFGGKSLYFDGSSKLEIVNSSFIFGNDNFTIDWWEYRQNNGTSLYVNAVDSGLCNLALGYNGSMLYASSSLSSWDVVGGETAFSATQNQWIHIAVIRNGTTLKIYENGAERWSKKWSLTTAPVFSGGTGRLIIGSNLGSGTLNYFKGYIDELRISNEAKWTANFTPPTEPYEDEKLPEPTSPTDPTYEYIVEYVQNTYTEWFEQNLPWKSEIDRIRDNFNNLIKEYLPKSNIKTINKNQYFKFSEANKIEEFSAYAKDMTEKMEHNFIRCGEANSGGERLL